MKVFDREDRLRVPDVAHRGAALRAFVVRAHPECRDVGRFGPVLCTVAEWSPPLPIVKGAVPQPRLAVQRSALRAIEPCSSIISFGVVSHLAMRRSAPASPALHSPASR